jgi:hypothetical protein
MQMIYSTTVGVRRCRTVLLRLMALERAIVSGGAKIADWAGRSVHGKRCWPGV